MWPNVKYLTRAWTRPRMWHCETLSYCLAGLEQQWERAVTFGFTQKVFFVLLEMLCCCWCAATQPNAPWCSVNWAWAVDCLLELQTFENQLANMTFLSSRSRVYTTQRGGEFNLMAYDQNSFRLVIGKHFLDRRDTGASVHPSIPSIICCSDWACCSCQVGSAGLL